jgi:hypothetical protein
MTPAHLNYMMALFWLTGYLGAIEHPHRGERIKLTTKGLIEFDRRITRPRI